MSKINYSWISTLIFFVQEKFTSNVSLTPNYSSVRMNTIDCDRNVLCHLLKQIGNKKWWNTLNTFQHFYYFVELGPKKWCESKNDAAFIPLISFHPVMIPSIIKRRYAKNSKKCLQLLKLITYLMPVIKDFIISHVK